MDDINKSEKSGKKKSKLRFSMKYWIMVLCLASVIVTATAVGGMVMPAVGKIYKEQVQTHVNDFVVAGTEIMEHVVAEMEEKMATIESTTQRLMVNYGSNMNPGVQVPESLPTETQEVENQSPENLNPEGQEPEGQNPEGLHAEDQNSEEEKEIFAESAGTFSREEMENSDIYGILSEQLVRYADPVETSDIIYVINANGEVVASNMTTSVAETLETELVDKALSGTVNMSVETIVYEEKGEVTLVFSKAIYVNNELKGAILYYTSSDFLYEKITELSLTGIAAPLVYIIDTNGVTIAHTIKDSIGNETGNELLYPVLEEIKAGKPLAAGAHYDTTPYGSDDNVQVTYAHIQNADWLFIAAALESQVYSGVSDINHTYILYTIIVLLIVLVIIFFGANSFAKPIEYMAQMIKRVGNLDFTLDLQDKKFQRVANRTDEIGEMGKSISLMVESVKEKLDGMNECSDKVNQAAMNLQEITNEISEKASDTSAITEQLSAGMQETNASTEMITGDVEVLKENVMDMKVQIDSNTALTMEIMERAKALKKQGEVAK